MIVKHHKEGWEIISHYAHGLLAGKIASQVKEELMSKNWVDILTGIIEHDDHLPDFDEQNYLTEKGTPKDFTMKGGSDKDALKHAECVYANSMQKSQLVALMVGRHLNFLYESLAKEYKPMKEFLDHVNTMGKDQRKLYGISKKKENDLYDIMLFSDRCSLILCQDAVPEVGRKIEINHTIKDKTYYIHLGKDDTMIVVPWPFKENTFEVNLEYRILNEVRFDTNEKLKKAIENAKVAMHTFTFSKSN